MASLQGLLHETQGLLDGIVSPVSWLSWSPRIPRISSIRIWPIYLKNSSFLRCFPPGPITKPHLEPSPQTTRLNVASMQQLLSSQRHLETKEVSEAGARCVLAKVSKVVYPKAKKNTKHQCWIPWWSSDSLSPAWQRKCEFVYVYVFYNINFIYTVYARNNKYPHQTMSFPLVVVTPDHPSP